MMLMTKLGLTRLLELGQDGRKSAKPERKSLKSSFWTRSSWRLCDSGHYSGFLLKKFMTSPANKHLPKGMFASIACHVSSSFLENIDRLPQQTLSRDCRKYLELNIARLFREGNEEV